MSEPRKKLRTISTKNQALQDILKTSGAAAEVISVEKQTSGIHNTKTILRMLDGHTRAHFYNRVPLKNTIPEGFLSSGDLSLDIEILNSLYGCDFTEDDLVMSCGKFLAKPDSLGYYSEGDVTGSSLPADKVGFGLCYFGSLRNKTYMLSLRINRFTPGVAEPEVLIYNSSNHTYNGSHYVPDDLGPVFDEITQQLPEWLTVTNIEHVWQFSGSGFNRQAIELTNQSADMIEVSVVLLVGDREEVTSAESLLTNARLLPKGSKLPYCPLSDTLYFKEDDFVNWRNGIYDLYDEVSEETTAYVGQYNSLNGATKNSWWLEESGDGVSTLPQNFHSDDAPLDPTFDFVNGPNVDCVRIFKEIVSHTTGSVTYGHEETSMVTASASTTKMIIANRFRTPVMIEDKAFLRPLRLTPFKNQYNPDEIFKDFMKSEGSWERLGTCQLKIIEVDDQGNPIHSVDAIDILVDIGKNNDAVNRLMSENVQLRTIVDMSMMVEITSQVYYLYIKNLTNKRLQVTLIEESEGFKLGAVLEPLNTPPVSIPSGAKSLNHFMLEEVPKVDVAPSEFRITYRGLTINDAFDLNYLLGFWLYFEEAGEARLASRSIFPEFIHIKAKWDLPEGAIEIEGGYVLEPDLIGGMWIEPS